MQQTFLPRAYPLQTHEMLFAAHNHAFEVLGGVTRRGIYDNMRIAVHKFRSGDPPRIQSVFGKAHYYAQKQIDNLQGGRRRAQKGVGAVVLVR